MSGSGEIEGLRRVKSYHKRRWPHCHSNKWDWLGAVPITIEELSYYLLVRYRCRKCGNEFVVEEGKKARYVTRADRCAHCNSPDIEQASKPGADVGVFRCRKCNAYMVVGEPVAESGPMIIDLSRQ